MQSGTHHSVHLPDLDILPTLKLLPLLRQTHHLLLHIAQDDSHLPLLALDVVHQDMRQHASARCILEHLDRLVGARAPDRVQHSAELEQALGGLATRETLHHGDFRSSKVRVGGADVGVAHGCAAGADASGRAGTVERESGGTLQQAAVAGGKPRGVRGGTARRIRRCFCQRGGLSWLRARPLGAPVQRDADQEAALVVWPPLRRLDEAERGSPNSCSPHLPRFALSRLPELLRCPLKLLVSCAAALKLGFTAVTCSNPHHQGRQSRHGDDVRRVGMQNALGHGGRGARGQGRTCGLGAPRRMLLGSDRFCSLARVARQRKTLPSSRYSHRDARVVSHSLLGTCGGRRRARHPTSAPLLPLSPNDGDPAVGWVSELYVTVIYPPSYEAHHTPSTRSQLARRLFFRIHVFPLPVASSPSAHLPH